MTAQNLKKSLLNYAISGKLSANWRKENPNSRIPNDLNSRIPTDFNPPFEIPNSWAWVKLGDLGDIITGSTPPKANKEFYGDDYPFYKPSDLDAGIRVENSADTISKKGFEASRKLPQNSILVTCIGATIGKTGLIHKEGICNQQINAILPNEKFISKFLFFAITSEFFQNEIKQNYSSTTLPILNKSKFSNLYIPLPPKDEQEFIVNELERLMSLADSYEVEFQKLENCKKELRNLKKSLLNYAISGKLSTNWRKENPNSRSPNDLNSRIPSDFNPPFEIPNSWQWVKLRDICEITSSKRILKSEYVKSGIPFYRTKEIVELSNKEKISTEFFISENRYNEIKSKFGIPQTNDLLISAVGTIGKIWLVDTNKPFYFKDGNLIWLKNSNSFNSLFLKYMLENQISKNKFSGTAYNALTIIFLKNLYIPLPPKDEQERIVKKIDELFEILEVIENSL